MRKERVTTVTCEFCSRRYDFAGEDFAPVAS